MDPRVTYFKAAFCPQTGGGFEFPVYQGRTQYGTGFNFPVFQGRSQYGQGVGDVLRGIWRFFRPVAMRGAQTLLKAGGEALKDGASMKEVLSNTLRPTLGAVLGATADQVASRLIGEKPTAAPPPGPPSAHPEATQVGTQAPPQNGSGKRKRTKVYKSKKYPSKRPSHNRGPRPIIYNF